MYVLAPNQTVETYPYSIGALRRDNLNTSFPRNPSEELLASWNVFPVVEVAAPSYDLATENCNQVNPTFQDGQWMMTWAVTTASSDEIAERLTAKSAEIRKQRNQLLSESDWTHMSDSPLSESDKTAWAAYRQSLRDLPSAAGFPFTMSWPEKP